MHEARHKNALVPTINVTKYVSFLGIYYNNRILALSPDPIFVAITLQKNHASTEEAGHQHVGSETEEGRQWAESRNLARGHLKR